jgi:hypothetical protein
MTMDVGLFDGIRDYMSIEILYINFGTRGFVISQLRLFKDKAVYLNNAVLWFI